MAKANTHTVISRYIVEARACANLTQEALGVVIGRTKQNISAWESGRHEPSPLLLAKIAKVTGLPLPNELSPHNGQRHQEEIQNSSRKNETVHERIRRLRTERGMSQDTLAKRCNLKSWQAVQQWEKGITAPKISRLSTVAEALGVSVNELLFGTDAGGQAPSQTLLTHPRSVETSTVGERIKDALKKKQLNQSKFAELCEVSDNAVSKWIKTGQVSKENITTVCQILDLDVGMFFPAGWAKTPKATLHTDVVRLAEDTARQSEYQLRQKKRAKITEEHVDEARKLRAIYDRKKAERGRDMPTQAEIGSKYGIGGQSMVAQCLGAQSALSLSAAIGFAKALNCEIADFSPRLATEQKKIAEPLLGHSKPDGSAAEIADALRVSVRAIAAQWNVAPEDLLDPSIEARERVEQAIATARWQPLEADRTIAEPKAAANRPHQSKTGKA